MIIKERVYFGTNNDMNILVQLIGLKRSGNHGFTGWLMDNGFPKQEAVTFHNAVYNERKRPPRITHPHHIAQPRARNDAMIISYEDVSLDAISDIPTLSRQHDILPEPDVKTILLLRSPENLLASRMSRLDQKGSRGEAVSDQRISWEEVMNLWKMYAREYLGSTQYLPSDTIRVSFDAWFSNKAYRDELLHTHFGVRTNRDLGLQIIMDNAGGSATDGMAYQGRAQKMEVLHRSHAYEKDSLFQRLISDQELQSLSQRIFCPTRVNGEYIASTRNRDRI